MEEKEHIACWFEPPAPASPFAGVGPADVHDRAPGKLPLVARGAEAVGDGVLAAAGGGQVVFDQLPPWSVSRAGGALPSFTVEEGGAAEGRRCALVVLGAVTGQGIQLGQKVKAGEPGETYTFAARVQGAGGPVKARLEIERPASPWDRAVKGDDVAVEDGVWTDLHVTFRVERPFPEGWFAYLASAQEGGRLRADGFRLHRGGYVPPGDPAAAGSPPDLLEDAGFEAGPGPWRFSFHEQLNLRKTYRRASFLLARLLANLGAAGATPLLDRFRVPPRAGAGTKDGGGGERRWLEGLYLDEPEAWDDPYRFFRW